MKAAGGTAILSLMDGTDGQKHLPPWRFDAVVVDPEKFEVRIDGKRQDLEPKSFRLLQFLIENEHRAVPKEELFQAVWDGVVVSDNAVSRAVAQIRKVLKDNPRQPKYIETVPTVGYRFIGTLGTPGMAGTAATPETSQPWMRLALVAAPLLLLAAGGVVMNRGSGTVNAKPSRAGAFLPVQLTSSPGLDVGAVYSPAGDKIAFASDRGGSFEIYLRNVKGAPAEIQVTRDGGNNVYPTFSPDGKWIAYQSLSSQGIYRISATGGEPQRVSTFGVQPIWSPDGHWIVFRSHGVTSFSTTDLYYPTDSHLYLVSASGGEPQRIGGPGIGPEGWQSFPTFRGDGKQIRFVNFFNDESSVWTYEIGSHAFRKLFGSKAITYSNATFDTKDRYVWFINCRLNGDISIQQMPLNPETLEPTGDPERISGPQLAASPRDLALSPDGKQLAFTSATSSGAILTQNLAGGDEPRNLITEASFRLLLLRASTSGTRFGYTSFPRNGNPMAWIADADGGHARPIGPEGVDSVFIGLNPDGKHALLASSCLSRDKGARLFTVRLADGAIVDKGPIQASTSHCMSSPDGKTLACLQAQGLRRFAVLRDLVSGAERRIEAEKQETGFPQISRNGEWLAVQLMGGGKMGTAVAMTPFAGGPLETLVQSAEPTHLGGWLPDHDRVFISANRGGIWNVWTLSRTTRKMVPVTHYTTPRTYVRYPEWLAGDRVAFEFNETKGNVFVAPVD